jgi:hypothetical protein
VKRKRGGFLDWLIVAYVAVIILGSLGGAIYAFLNQ